MGPDKFEFRHFNGLTTCTHRQLLIQLQLLLFFLKKQKLRFKTKKNIYDKLATKINNVSIVYLDFNQKHHNKLFCSQNYFLIYFHKTHLIKNVRT